MTMDDNDFSIEDAIVELEAADDELSARIANWLRLLRSEMWKHFKSLTPLSLTEDEALILTVDRGLLESSLDLDDMMQVAVDAADSLYPEDMTATPIIVLLTEGMVMTAIPKEHVNAVVEAAMQKDKH